MDTLQISSVKEQLYVRKDRINEAMKQMPGNSQLVDLLKQVDSALEKISSGTYGICEVCKESVEEERLFIDPLVSVCLGCLNEAQQRALENDLEFAAKIQRNLLPKNNQKISGWDFCYHFDPAGPVSGDFTDIIPLNDGSVIFIIGDVSGKGIAASLMMSHLHGLIHSLLSFELPVNKIVEKVNMLFNESTLFSNYATMVLGKAFPDGKIEICIAGHNPPLLLKNGEVNGLNATGMPVGLFSNAQYEVRTIQLQQGDALLLYTDGLTESEVNNIEYGEDRVINYLASTNGQASKSLINELINDHTQWLSNNKPADDLTVLAIKRME